MAQRCGLVRIGHALLAQLLEIGVAHRDQLVEFLDARFGAGQFAEHGPGLDLDDLVGAGARIALEIDKPGGNRGQHDGDQHAGQFWRLAPEHPDDGDRRDPHRQRRQVGIADQLEHLPDVAQEGLRAAHRHADQLVDLGQRDDDRRSIGEADDHRMGQEIHHDAQLEHTEGQLDHADHQRQHDGQRNELFAAGDGQRRQRRGSQQRDHGHRAGAKLVRGTPEGRHRNRQEGRVKPVVGGHPRQLGIGHGLRHQYQGDGDARYEVGAQRRPGIGKPAQEGQEALQQLRAHVAGMIPCVGGSI